MVVCAKTCRDCRSEDQELARRGLVIDPCVESNLELGSFFTFFSAGFGR